MFEVQDRFECIQQTITVYAVKNEGDTTFFLMYHRKNGQWKWKKANRFIPIK